MVELFRVGALKAIALDGAIHRAALQALLERGADYARLVDGQDPGPDAARELFADGPPGYPPEAKFVIGLLDPSGALIAVLEGMRDYPDPGTWWIGLMLLDPAWRGRGLGARLYRAFEAYAGEQGATALGLGVVEANAGARRFWERVGFAAVRVTEPRRFGAREHAVIVMRRALDDRRRDGAGAGNHHAQRQGGDHVEAGYTIRLAREGDIDALPGIERAANRLFAAWGWDEDLLAGATPPEALHMALAAGRLWVAADADDRPVGFAVASIVDGRAHLDEIDVHPDHGRRGLGRALVEQVCAWAAAGGLPAVTLTTERDIPWNAPFYRRLGFEVLPPSAWTPGLRAIVAHETLAGLDPAGRVVMIRAV